MTHRRVLVLTCDWPECERVIWHLDDLLISELRANARAHGWDYQDRRDWCRQHVLTITKAEAVLVTADLSRAVLAEDLRALAEYGRLDAAAVDMLEQAADMLDTNEPAPSSAREAPSVEVTTEAIENALDSGLYELTLTQDGKPAELWQLARCLGKAGLIDWSGI